jgi:hypothetical protein
MYVVSADSEAEGVKVACVPEQATVPATLTPPTDSPNVAVVRVEQFIASLKVTVSPLVTGTPVVDIAGRVATTVGAEPATPLVVKLQLKSAASATPEPLFAPVCTAAV